MFALARIFGSPSRPPAHVLAVANAILDALDRDGQEANLIRLQRLLVLAQCRSLSTRNEPLFAEPVIVLGDTAGIACIHHAFRRWSWMAIPGRAMHPDLGFEHPADQDPTRLSVVRETVEGHHGQSGLDLGALLRRILPEEPNGTVLEHGTLERAFLRMTR